MNSTAWGHRVDSSDLAELGASEIRRAALPAMQQLDHPNAEAIWSRAVEVFSGEEAAKTWLHTSLPILGNQTPQCYADSSDPAKQREVLMILNRIDFGMFS